MGKTTGFLEYARKDNTVIAPEERICNYNEFRLPMDEEERREQGARCMNCGVPLCQSGMTLSGMVTGCPLHNLIPEWNHEVYMGHPSHAASRLLKTNNFPEFTGRVCPALCEKACICGMHDDPVTAHENELYIIETAFAEGHMKPRIPAVRSGRKVAVIGSGPSGLAAADQLNHRGHSVTVFEREDRIGGLLMYGIPNMKLDKRVIERRQRLMEEEGVIFRTGINVGKDITASEILNDFDAVILSCGAKKARPLAIPDAEKVRGIVYAVDFLTGTTKALLAGEIISKETKRTASFSEHVAFHGKDRLMKDGDGTDREKTAGLLRGGHADATWLGTGNHADATGQDAGDYVEQRETWKKRGSTTGFISAAGKHVVIVGGGDTGNDCVATAIRHGCVSVTQIEMMPCPPEERSESNPWPEWPKVKKTDYGQVEAIHVFGQDPRIYETTVKEAVTDEEGLLKAVKLVGVRFEGRILVEVPGTEREIPCDLLIIAAGFLGCENYVAEAFNAALTPRGVIQTEDGKYATSVSKVFSAGDMRRGQSLVVWAIREGRGCAAEVDEFLMGYRP